MSHGAAAGGEGEEAEEAEEEEDEEEESAPPEFDARCQATPLELVRARACVRGNVSAVVGFVWSCARARSCVYVGTDSRRGEPRTGREVCRGVQTEIRGGDFGWAGRGGREGRV